MRATLQRAALRCVVATLCALVVFPGETLGYFAATQEQASSAGKNPEQTSSGKEAEKLPPDELDSLVAPIALYPDPLLAQTLAASTYPLELIQLQQWLKKNPKLKDKELSDAVAKESWDPSVQAMAGLPEVVNRLANDIQWTTDLGNAFLAQQSDVMDAVQRMRKKAEDKGNLKSNEQQKVETKVVENKTVIVVEQANPQVVYVPSYNPVVVYGAPVYAYPAVYYPPPGYYAAGMAVSFGVGVAMGAMWSGGWGWGCGWGGNNVQINNYNNFNRSANINRNANVNRNISANRSGTWQHNPQHRGGAPYRDRATADRYGGAARGDSLANRQASARQQVGQRSANSSNRTAAGAAGSRPTAAGTAGSRSAAAGTSGGTAGSRASTGGTARSSGSRSGGGGLNAFGGSGGGYNGSSARAAGSRGSSSMGSRGGGRGRR